MPMNLADYHPDWRWISKQVREQANNTCEQCGVSNHAVGARDYQRNWHSETSIDSMSTKTRKYLFGSVFGGECPDMIRIVLTVAHLDHDRDNNDPANLRALCQRCHLNWDRDQHIESRRKSALDRNALIGGAA